MTGMSLLLFPLVLFTQMQGGIHDVADLRRNQLAEHGSRWVDGHAPSSVVRVGAVNGVPLADAFRPRPVRQVRIEHRVIVRVVPMGRATRSNGWTDAGTTVPIRVVERPVAGCVPVRNIAGVSADRAGRLRLHMRGRQVLTVRFAGECRPDAFYSGFYIEPNRDGLMCPARDAVHSRSGMRCTLGRFGQLVAERAD